MFQDDYGRDTVVPFAQTRSCLRFQSISVVRAYWEALRAGRDVPYRSEIDPRGIETALEHTFVLERIAPRIARFRLAGVHLCDLMGMEVRGMPITAFFAPAARAEVEEVLARVFEGPETAELSLEGEVSQGRPHIEAKLLLLPMKSDLGDVSRALGCLVASGPVGRTPRRFQITAARVRSTRDAADLRPAPPSFTAPSRVTAPVTAGFADSPAPYSPARPHGNRAERPYLRLVTSAPE